MNDPDLFLSEAEDWAGVAADALNRRNGASSMDAAYHLNREATADALVSIAHALVVLARASQGRDTAPTTNHPKEV